MPAEPSRTGLTDITNLPRRHLTQPQSPMLKTKARGDSLFTTLSSEQRTLTEIHSRPMFKARKVPRTHYEFSGDKVQTKPKHEEKQFKTPLYVPSVPFRAMPLNPNIIAGATFAVQYERKYTVPQPPELQTQLRAEQRSASLNSSVVVMRPNSPPVSLRDTLKLLLGKMEGQSQTEEAMDLDS